MTAPRKGDLAFFVDDSSDHPVVRVRKVTQAGPRRVTTEGPGGRRTHLLIGDGSRYVPTLHLSPVNALVEFVRRREADVDVHDRRKARAVADLVDGRRLLADYRSAADRVTPPEQLARNKCYACKTDGTLCDRCFAEDAEMRRG